MFSNFPVFLLWCTGLEVCRVISKYLWIFQLSFCYWFWLSSENILRMISVGPLLMSVLCALEKHLHPVIVGWDSLYLSTRLTWLLFKYSKSLLICCLLVQSLPRQWLKSLTTIVDLSIFSCSSIHFHFMYFEALLLGVIKGTSFALTRTERSSRPGLCEHWKWLIALQSLHKLLQYCIFQSIWATMCYGNRQPPHLSGL